MEGSSVEGKKKMENLESASGSLIGCDATAGFNPQPLGSTAVAAIIMGAEDCGSCSDDDVYVQGINKDDDDDDEENWYSSGFLPKLQFRKDISKALWVDDLAMAEVVEKKGKMWVTMGIVRSGNTYCSIEETLFLIEIGALHLFDEKGIFISLREVYEKLSCEKNGCFWELFEVYRHLKSLGYVVGRHGIPWSMKGQKIKGRNCLLQGSQEINELPEMESKDNNTIIELFHNMQIMELRPAFDVFLPNSKFRKSSPGDPSFVVYLSRGTPPSRVEIEALERKHGAIPLKFCHVEYGRVSFFSFDRVELDVLP